MTSGKLRILAFADLHEEEAALESLARLAPSFDLVFGCGDLAQSGWFAESVIEGLPQAFLVPGNWDSERSNGILSSSPGWLHEKRRELECGLNAVGFGFSNRTPFGTFGELEEENILSRMSRLPIDESTLLLLHCPPQGSFDLVRGKHVGSSSILGIIRERQPLAAFCGHIHEHSGVSYIGRTAIIKLPPAEAMRACSASATNKKITADFISL